MKAKLIVEGKEFPIEINDPELEKLLRSQKKTGYERVNIEETYYTANVFGDLYVSEFFDSRRYEDDVVYDDADYYSDRTVAENNARADRLMRQLRRFAVEHREKKLDWNNANQNKYYIFYDHRQQKIRYDYNKYLNVYGVIYFDSKETVELAVKTFHDELIWYFTEYKDSL